jgi:hypothetical protein
MQWAHRVEVFGMEWQRNDRLPDAEGLQRKLNEWGSEGWELVSFEPVRDEAPPADQPGEAGPRAAYLAILKRPASSP